MRLLSKSPGEKPKTSNLLPQLGDRIGLLLDREHAALATEQEGEAVDDLPLWPRVPAGAGQVGQSFVEVLLARHQRPIVTAVWGSEQVSTWPKEAANCTGVGVADWVFIAAGPGLSTARKKTLQRQADVCSYNVKTR